jgi:Deltex C-terminal domain
MPERSSVATKDNGFSFGHGIYTGSNPCTYHGKYGDVGIMVVRLVGTHRDHRTSTSSDTVTVAAKQVAEMMILTSSKQCIPILQFDAKQIVPNDFGHPGNVSLSTYHFELQRLIDEMLQRRNVKARVVQAVGRIISQVVPALARQQVAPQTLNLAPEKVRYTAPEKLGLGPLVAAGWHKVILSVAVVLCSLAASIVLGGLVVSIVLGSVWIWNRTMYKKGSKHVYDPDSLVNSLFSCFGGRSVGWPRGDMPSGEMTIGKMAQPCAGYDGFTTIAIDYNMPAGVQKSYHSNPGVGFQGICRRALVPCTAEGCALVKRLKFAFKHGLTFSVGFSGATGQDNSVLWASIPHKTSFAGGVPQYGFPDPYYIANCKEQLDKLHVPKTEFL